MPGLERGLRSCEVVPSYFIFHSACFTSCGSLGLSTRAKEQRLEAFSTRETNAGSELMTTPSPQSQPSILFIIQCADLVRLPAPNFFEMLLSVACQRTTCEQRYNCHIHRLSWPSVLFLCFNQDLVETFLLSTFCKAVAAHCNHHRCVPA